MKNGQSYTSVKLNRALIKIRYIKKHVKNHIRKYQKMIKKRSKSLIFTFFMKFTRSKRSVILKNTKNVILCVFSQKTSNFCIFWVKKWQNFKFSKFEIQKFSKNDKILTKNVCFLRFSWNSSKSGQNLVAIVDKLQKTQKVTTKFHVFFVRPTRKLSVFGLSDLIIFRYFSCFFVFLDQKTSVFRQCIFWCPVF